MTKNYLVNGTDRYVMDFRSQSSGTWKIFSLEHPYDPYGKSVVDNHLYPSGEICVLAGYEPRTLDQAKAFAMVWCQGWSEYVRTGVFPKGSKRVNV